ncbi:unnamed protein product [Cyprideis torosa]|uniref:Uncharacterized protein n=1 Tax=Cyprideis torosa TaxID=163714 RepID=A0A7R8WDN3_9CRUS|nr:unnamed protein product [Cyprideis torosa]CAG0888755.1 unnamed protein product [Cyprideis torosa]
MGTPRLNREEILLLKEAFQIFDSDKDGKITTKELGAAMRALGHHPTDAELEDMITKADLNRDGTVDFKEFVVMMADKMQPSTTLEAEIKEAFKVFDTNRDGFIEPEELRQVLANLGEKVTLQDAVQMINEADMDGDGRVCCLRRICRTNHTTRTTTFTAHTTGPVFNLGGPEDQSKRPTSSKTKTKKPFSVQKGSPVSKSRQGKSSTERKRKK